VFQTVGAGSHYLAGAAYRGQGTPTINAALALELKRKTTYPPTLRTANFTAPEVLGPNPAVPRDTGCAPDLGYHYDPLDYVVNGRTVSAALTLGGGVVLGTYGALNSYGLLLVSGGSLTSQGTPTALNRIVRYNTAQEHSAGSWSAGTVGAGVRRYSTSAALSAAYTAWSLLAGLGDHFSDQVGGPTPSLFTHCQFSGEIDN
jgi:hypothetical protein